MEYTEFEFALKDGTYTGELLIGWLSEAGFESFVEQESCLMAYIPSSEVNQRLMNMLDSEELHHFYNSFTQKVIAEQNWNAVWESQYEPVTIAGKCHVRAPFHPAPVGIPFDIVIEPKMSFGTAHHETTRLMIEYLLETNVASKVVLDMGCGTGVLAILASMKGAGPVTAIDNDEWAYRNSFENKELNHQEHIEVLHGDATLLHGRFFDLILANINRNILLNDIPAYSACLSKDGTLIMSGFYLKDLEAIMENARKHSLLYESHRVLNDWTAARFIKTS